MRSAGGAVLERTVAGGAEQPPIWGGAVGLEVGTQQGRQRWRNEDRARLATGTVLEPAGLRERGVVGPGPAEVRLSCGQVDPTPPRGGLAAVARGACQSGDGGGI
jgi:hypothetical protein